MNGTLRDHPLIRLAFWLNRRLPVRFILQSWAGVAYGTGLVMGIVASWPGQTGLARVQLLGIPRYHLWAAMILIGSLLSLTGWWRPWWRLEVAGCVLLGTGVTCYGILLIGYSDVDPAVIGISPIGMGVGAAARILGLFVSGTIVEERAGGRHGR